MGNSVFELGQLATRKAAELHEFYQKHKIPDQFDEKGRPLFDFTALDLVEVKDRNDELNKINEELEAARASDIYEDNQKRLDRYSEVVPRIVHGEPSAERRQDAYKAHIERGGTLADLVVGTREYKGRGSSPRFKVDLPDVDVKTLLERSTGFTPARNRSDRIVLSAQRRLVVADLIPSDSTTADVIKWMEETTFTNAAATVSEAGLKPESALAFTERTQPVEKVATWLPVTEEQVDDVPQLRGVIDNRLTLMLQLVEEVQLLTGNGTPPNLTGFLNKAGVQTQAKGADPTPDAVYKAFTLVRYTGFAEPSGVVMHPNDWQDVQLLRTADGLYIWGNPSEDGVERIWGKPVVVTPAITENTALTGDFQMYSHISRKMGIRIDVSDSHSDYFIYNKLAIRAEERLSLEILRGAAFAKVTGI